MSHLFRKQFLFVLIIILICKFTSENGMIEKEDNFKSHNNLSKKGQTTISIENKNNEANHPSLNKSIDGNESLKDNIIKFNIYHISFCFLFIPAFSIFLIFFDLYEDKKLTIKYNYSISEKANQEFKALKDSYITRGKLLFSLFLLKYTYPLFSLFSIYNYNYPRYVRFTISIIKILFNLLITSTMLFVVKNDEKKLDEPGFILISISVMFVNTLIMHFFAEFTVNYLLEYVKIRRNIFKPKLENLRKYVYYIIKKDILFNSKWHSIRNRMVSYYRICGQTILTNYKKYKYDKYQRYVSNKLMNARSNLSETLNSFNSSLANNEEEIANFENTGLKERFLVSNDTIKKNIVSEKPKKIILKDNYINKNAKNISSHLCISKGVEPFSFSKFGVNNMKLKTLKKIEDIRNRYINNKKNKYEEHLDVEENIKTFDNLEIEALENYTYISTDAIINKLNRINSNSNNMIFNQLINLALLIILILINIGLVLMYLTIKENDNIILRLSSVLIGIIIIDYLIYFLLNLLISFKISKWYGSKKRNCFYKVVYNKLVEKYIRYLYRMRLLLIKYKKEFDFIENK